MKYFIFLVLAFESFFFQVSYAQTSSVNDSISAGQVEKIHTVTEFEASFPGGGFLRNKYFYNFIEKNRKVLTSEGLQFCYLKFVVDKEGNISEIVSRNSVETKLDEVVIKALKAGPKWVPARKNGDKVKAYASLTIIFESKKSGNPAFARNLIKYFLTKENKVEKQVKKLLILVAGTIPARIFTDQLYENLKIDLNINDVETEYFFLGNEKKAVRDNFMSVSNWKTFDAILLFIQEDSAKIKEVYYETEVSIRSISLQQSMNIFLIEPGGFGNIYYGSKIIYEFSINEKIRLCKSI